MLIKSAVSKIKENKSSYFKVAVGSLVLNTIFYAFLTLYSFLNSKPGLSNHDMPVLFYFGMFFTGVVFVFYLLYTNHFLFKYNQKTNQEIAKTPIKQAFVLLIQFGLITIATTLLAVILGTFLAQGLLILISGSIGVLVKSFIGIKPVLVISVLILTMATVIFGAILNFLQAKIKLPVVQVEKIRQYRNPWLTAAQVILSVFLFLVAYVIIPDRFTSDVLVLITAVAFFCVVAGTYFAFNALYPVIVSFLLKWSWFRNRKSNRFTLEQLQTKLIHHNKRFSLVTVLIAGAMGAILIGMSLPKMTDEYTSQSAFYDTAVYNQTPEVNQTVSTLPITEQSTFHYKVDGKNVYTLQNEVDNQVIKVNDIDFKNSLGSSQRAAYHTLTYQGDAAKDSLKQFIASAYEIIHPDNAIWENTFELPDDVTYYYLNQEEFDKIQVDNHQLQLIKTKGGVGQNKAALIKLEQQQLGDRISEERIGGMKNNQVGGQGITYFRQLLGMFLSIQWIAIGISLSLFVMAVMLILFKLINAGSNYYHELVKTGVQQSVIKKSIKKEVTVLWLMMVVPAVIGTFIGLNVFKFSPNLFDNLLIPIGVFSSFVLVAYLITMFSYQNFILKSLNN